MRSQRWIPALLVAALLAGLLWQVQASRARTRAARARGSSNGTNAAAAQVAPGQRLLAVAGEVADAELQERAHKLSPRAAAFIERVDDLYPRHLYAAAAGCYEGGIQRDYKMRFAYKLAGVGGEVRVTDARLIYSNFEDGKLEGCMREAILGAHWRDDEMPDFTDEDELLVRVRGMKKYLQPDDGDPSGADLDGGADGDGDGSGEAD